MNFLANDVVEGREAGTRGYDVAAAYVAQVEAVGAGAAQGMPARTLISCSSARIS
jgi:hypothetical protein